MKMLVTGALGFIGRHFLIATLVAGLPIAAMHRAPLPRRSELVYELRERGVSFHRGNVVDKESLRSAMRGVDCVSHFAGAFRESKVSDDYFFEVNVNGTRNAMEAASERGVRRFVYCSTAGIYGSQVPGVVDESAHVNPANAYERSKVAAEDVVRTTAAKYGMEYAIVRPTVVYGPYDARLRKMFKSADNGRFPLFGSGSGRRHMVFVEDVADAMLRAAVLPQAAGQEFIIAGPRAAPLREIHAELARAVNRPRSGPRLPLAPMLALAAMTEDVCKFVGVSPPIYRRRMDFYLNDTAFDCTHARRVLNWTPAVDIDEGFRRTVTAYRQNDWV